MQITFFDTSDSWSKLLPLTYTRPIAELRVGILKIHEKWQYWLSVEQVFFKTEPHLTKLFPPSTDKTLHLKGNLLPTGQLIEEIQSLKEDEVLIAGEEILAGFYRAEDEISTINKKAIEITSFESIDYPWDIFQKNGEQIVNDYTLLTKDKATPKHSDPHTKTYGNNIFLEEGAKLKSAVLNAENGPIYIGKNAEVQEGALIRGPFALCEHSVVNMGAKIRGDSTIGPHSKVGGEISNSVFQGFSNKGHDGFLGNSVIGEWCNLGADTNNSNLKNNYANVKMWDFDSERFKDTGLQFCGLVMGDHSKCGINTMFNTGTTVGVSANIFGDGFPRNFIPSFAWGGASGFSTYLPKKAFETAELVLKRRKISFTDTDKDMLTKVFEMTTKYRVWEKK